MMFDKLKDLKESTRRAWRTARQALLATGAAFIAVAIEPVRGAVNALIDLLPWSVPDVSPGLVAAVGLTGSALVALVTKLDNLFEGRDQMGSMEDYAKAVVELTGLAEALANAASDAGVEVGKILDGFNVEYESDGTPGRHEMVPDES